MTNVFFTYSPPVKGSSHYQEGMHDFENFVKLISDKYPHRKLSVVYSNKDDHAHIHGILETTIRPDNVRRFIVKKWFPECYEKLHNILQFSKVRELYATIRYMIENVYEKDGKIMIDGHSLQKYKDKTQVNDDTVIRNIKLDKLMKYAYDWVMQRKSYEETMSINLGEITHREFNNFLNELAKKKISLCMVSRHFDVIYKQMCVWNGEDVSEWIRPKLT